MTSMTMYSEWTAPTMLSSMWAEPTTRRTRAAHRVSGWVAVVDTTVRLLYPLVATAAVIFAALMWPGTAHSDPVDTTANAAGVNAGPIKTSIAEFGQSLCPMLVKPGSNLATNASQLQGNGASDEHDRGCGHRNGHPDGMPGDHVPARQRRHVVAVFSAAADECQAHPGDRAATAGAGVLTAGASQPPTASE